MRKTFLVMIALMMVAMVGMTSCEKEKTSTRPSKALVGTWRATDDSFEWYHYYHSDPDYIDVTFNADGYGMFERYYEEDGVYELEEREMFSYTYYEEDGTLLLPYESEFTDFLDRIGVADDGYKSREPEPEAYAALTVKSFTSESFVLIDHQASSSKTLLFKKVK